MKCFRSTPAVYESVRSTLDAAYGYPNAETKTETAIPPVEELPRDDIGRVYLAVSDEQCAYVLPAQLIVELAESGAVEEVSEGQYLSVCRTPLVWPGKAI